MTPVVANVLQPLIDAADAILMFLHDDAGFGWGMSIVGMTVIVRLVMVPLNYRFKGREIADQLSDSGATGLIFGEAFREEVEAARSELPRLRTLVVGEALPADIGSLQDLAAAASDAEPEVVVSEQDLFYLGYTSGTTGKPKGAMIAHRNRALAYHYWALEYGIGGADVTLHAGPFHHTAPFTFTLMQLYRGGCVVILPGFDPSLAISAIAREGVTWCFMVPYMFNAILELPSRDLAGFHCNCDALRLFISGGSAMPTPTKEGLLRTFPSVALHEFYGATEAGVICNLRHEDQKRKTRCIGKPVLDCEIKVLTEDGGDAPPGEIGDLWMRSPTLFGGYYNSPDKTAEVFRGDWCTLGDLGKSDEEGYFYIVDRRKDVIKSGGVNIFPAEIEEALLTHRSVVEAAVIGIPDRRWGEAAHAVVVLRPGGGVSGEDLIELCRGMLAGYKVPKSLEFRDHLPKSPAGKVLKRQLRDGFPGAVSG